MPGSGSSFTPHVNWPPYLPSRWIGLRGTGHVEPLVRCCLCPYVVRNFDLDYVGLLWFSDLVWRTDKWVLQLGNVHETGISRMKSRAASNPKDYLDVLNAVKAAYRILLTRAMKGVYIWCEDQETREFLEQCLSDGTSVR